MTTVEMIVTAALAETSIKPSKGGLSSAMLELGIVPATHRHRPRAEPISKTHDDPVAGWRKRQVSHLQTRTKHGIHKHFKEPSL